MIDIFQERMFYTLNVLDKGPVKLMTKLFRNRRNVFFFYPYPIKKRLWPVAKETGERIGFHLRCHTLTNSFTQLDSFRVQSKELT